MYKLFLLAVTIGGFAFAGTFNNTGKVSGSSGTVKSQLCLAEDTSKDDIKLERRRRGKGNGKRKRGGNGLR